MKKGMIIIAFLMLFVSISFAQLSLRGIDLSFGVPKNSKTQKLSPEEREMRKLEIEAKTLRLREEIRERKAREERLADSIAIEKMKNDAIVAEAKRIDSLYEVNQESWEGFAAPKLYTVQMPVMEYKNPTLCLGLNNIDSVDIPGVFDLSSDDARLVMTARFNVYDAWIKHKYWLLADAAVRFFGSGDILDVSYSYYACDLTRYPCVKIVCPDLTVVYYFCGGCNNGKLYVGAEELVIRDFLKKYNITIKDHLDMQGGHY